MKQLRLRKKIQKYSKEILNTMKNAQISMITWNY